MAYPFDTAQQGTSYRQSEQNCPSDVLCLTPCGDAWERVGKVPPKIPQGGAAMRNGMTAMLRSGAAIGVGIWLAVATLSAQPAAAQLGFAAVAISPSTLDRGSSAGTSSQASAELSALRGCQSTCAKDCKVVYSVG